MWHRKKKNNTKLETKPGRDHVQSAGSRNLSYPIIIMLQLFTEYSVIL